MSSGDRRRRDEERAARRAKRLAEREQRRATRKADEARKAAERADELARKADRRSSRDRDRSFEDYVDEFTEKWERKAEEWIEDQTRKLFSEDGYHVEDDYDGMTGDAMSMGMDDDMSGDESRESEETRADRERQRRQRERASAARSHRRRRRSRSSRRRRGHRESLRSRLNSGRNLYRDKERGKICGVCAGTAEYLDVETWQVRLVAVLGLIFIPSVAITVYFITYFLMDDKPYYRRVTDRYEEPEDYDDFEGEEDLEGEVNTYRRGQRNRQPQMSNAEAFRTAKEKFADIEGRLRSMESHVTSSKFELQRELKKIAGEDA